ncbi:hypothetical protein Pcinc_032000 [Petrolisthes cinctipes]|uniref:Uncharacterized protein n=1 Tax=Petrolisthes cinctipes TaxID=88211 RepID=A0AAE1EV23_PETCI|nr:hypothetical protein Pcinc_032000 [Petrolisthes cinctipes]
MEEEEVENVKKKEELFWVVSNTSSLPMYYCTFYHITSLINIQPLQRTSIDSCQDTECGLCVLRALVTCDVLCISVYNRERAMCVPKYERRASLSACGVRVDRSYSGFLCVGVVKRRSGCGRRGSTRLIFSQRSHTSLALKSHSRCGEAVRRKLAGRVE